MRIDFLRGKKERKKKERVSIKKNIEKKNVGMKARRLLIQYKPHNWNVHKEYNETKITILVSVSVRILL